MHIIIQILSQTHIKTNKKKNLYSTIYTPEFKKCLTLRHHVNQNRAKWIRAFVECLNELVIAELNILGNFQEETHWFIPGFG